METTRQTIDQKAVRAMKLGGQAVITGSWVWVTFDSKPDKSTREQLKELGYKWAPKKGKWYFAGKPRAGRKPMSWDYIVDKYGVEEVTV